MTVRTFFGGIALSLVAISLPAQEHPAKRLANIVGVAIEEYGKAVDERGRLLSDLEYQEANDFLADATGVAKRLAGADAARAAAILDTIVVAVRERRAPTTVSALHSRFTEALGRDGALDLPAQPLDIANGRALYAANCASCHGALGGGDGVAAAGMTPAPTALGTVAAMHDVSPALMYRVVSVGIAGTPMTAWAERLTPEQRWNVIAYVNTLRSTLAQRLEGEGLYLQGCVSCHGALGAGDGALATALTRLPPDVGSLAWQAERSDAQLAVVVRKGLPGTAMPPSRNLSDGEISAVVAHLRTLPLRSSTERIAAGPNERGNSDRAARDVLSLLDNALASARAGRPEEAADRAFDAYIAFEPLETPARAKSPGLVANMERHFADFKGAVRASRIAEAERARNAIDLGLPAVLELTRAASGRWGMFMASFLIILREGLEAILVIGAIVTFLIKTGNRQRLRNIWWGVGLALAASAVTTVVLQTALRAMPATREVIEGITMLVAVVVLFSVSYWLISKVEAARWQQFIREKVSSALEHGGGRALTFVAFLAVYREGAETALFYQALFNEGAGHGGPIVLGILVGFTALAVIFTLFYRFGVRIPLRPFFAGTSVLLYYMAFVFMGKGIRELQEGNIVPITTIPGIPQVQWLGLFNTVETLLGQFVLVLLFLFALVKTFWPRRAMALPTVTSAPAPAPASDIETRMAELQATAMRLERKLDALEDAIAAPVEARGDVP